MVRGDSLRCSDVADPPHMTRRMLATADRTILPVARAAERRGLDGLGGVRGRRCPARGGGAFRNIG